MRIRSLSLLLIALSPVSYTHLDVYKRQHKGIAQGFGGMVLPLGSILPAVFIRCV